MSIYKQYTDCIKTFIDLDKNDWTFKSNPNYTYMLEHVDAIQGNNYLNEIANKFSVLYTENKNYLIELCHRNDLYGNCKKNSFENFTTCSPTNLRYILHSLLILTYAKECNLYTLDVVEIGGGYGGLCFYINNIAKLFNININTYTIFDLEEPLLLQNKYLDALNINDTCTDTGTGTKMNYFTIENFENINQNSFLISNYAFSEIPIDIQKEYTDKLLNPYISYGFITWNEIDLYKFIDNKIVSIEREFPLTGPNNYYVKFKPS